MPRAIAPDRFRRATESAYNEVFAATGTTAAGIFAALAASEKLGPGSWLQLRDDTPFQLRDGGERLEIALAAKVVTLPASARAGFARLQAGAATFAEIDAVLPAGTAPTFVRTLVLEGLIRIDRVVASRPSDAR
jgi:hypothetical protein